MNNKWIAELERLRKQIKILELKNSGSLANNLCPDHRDKQAGKSCLACEIERLWAEKKDLLEACKMAREYIGEYCPEIGGILTITLDAAITRCEK